MGKARSVLFGGVVGAAIGVVLAPRRGESRREALGRLRLAARPGGRALQDFAGTPCAADPAITRGGTPPGAEQAPRPAAEGGQDE